MRNAAWPRYVTTKEGYTIHVKDNCGKVTSQACTMSRCSQQPQCILSVVHVASASTDGEQELLTTAAAAYAL